MGFYTFQNKYLLRCLRYLSRAFQLFRFDSVSGRRIFCMGTVFFNQAVSFFLPVFRTGLYVNCKRFRFSEALFFRPAHLPHFAHKLQLKRLFISEVL